MKRFACLLLLCLLALPAAAETLPEQGMSFIQDTGIAADSVVLMGQELVVFLTDGGTATLYTNGDFDPFDLRWVFSGAADEDMARYLDYALGLLATIEQRIPADESALTPAELQRAESNKAVVSAGLLALGNTGEQGLRVLGAQMDAQPDSPLNSLRARLADNLAALCMPAVE